MFEIFWLIIHTIFYIILIIMIQKGLSSIIDWNMVHYQISKYVPISIRKKIKNPNVKLSNPFNPNVIPFSLPKNIPKNNQNNINNINNNDNIIINNNTSNHSNVIPPQNIGGALSGQYIQPSIGIPNENAPIPPTSTSNLASLNLPIPKNSDNDNINNNNNIDGKAYFKPNKNTMDLRSKTLPVNVIPRIQIPRPSDNNNIDAPLSVSSNGNKEFQSKFGPEFDIIAQNINDGNEISNMDRNKFRPYTRSPQRRHNNEDKHNRNKAFPSNLPPDYLPIHSNVCTVYIY